MKASNPGNLKLVMENIFTSWWPLMTPYDPTYDKKLKIAKLWLYVHQMKASNPGDLEIAMYYIFDLILVTSNDP